MVTYSFHCIILGVGREEMNTKITFQQNSEVPQDLWPGLKLTRATLMSARQLSHALVKFQSACILIRIDGN